MEIICPRSGFLRLAHEDHNHTIRTVCKTWGCKVCAPKVEALVGMRIRYGLETGTHSWFIVLTYRMAYDSMVQGAKSAGRDMAQFWRRVQCELLEKPAWFRIPELTKKGQIHHHVLMLTEEEGTDTCRRKRETYLTWRQNGCRDSDGECVEHMFSRIWEAVTGDSFVVHVSRIKSVARSATYITKYLRKGFNDRGAMEALGYKRRWSRSRNWPGGYALRLAGTEAGAWGGLKYYGMSKVDPVLRGKLMEEEKEPSACPEMLQVGTDLALGLFGGGKQKRAAKVIRKAVA